MKTLSPAQRRILAENRLPFSEQAFADLLRECVAEHTDKDIAIILRASVRSVRKWKKYLARPQ